MSDERPVLLCDIGNVLLQVDRQGTWQSLGQHLGASGTRVRELLAEHPIHRELELGLISPEEFLRRMLQELHCPGALTLAQLRDSMGQSFSGNTRLVECINQFRQHVRIILLSNTNAIDIPSIEEQFGLLHWADGAVLSYQVHLRKPDPAIYRYTIEHYHLQPDRTVFIDDLPENVTAARQAGLRAAVYESPGQVEHLLKDLLDKKLQD